MAFCTRTDLAIRDGEHGHGHSTVRSPLGTVWIAAGRWDADWRLAARQCRDDVVTAALVPATTRSVELAGRYSALMIVWVASFPRSGNTFLRIVLHRLYGIRTSVVYDVDGVAVRLGSDLVGFTERPAPIDAMRLSPDVHFVKTHRQRDAQVHEMDSAICLVRDGRDALVSWARQASEDDPGRYHTELATMITRNAAVGTGSWGRNVLSWLQPPAPHRMLLRYEDLIRTPARTVERVITALTPALAPRADAVIPSMDDLRQVDDRFFRRGHTGTHQDELPDDLHQLFWSRPDNATAMRLLDYDGTGSGVEEPA